MHNKKIKKKQKLTREWFSQLQNIICNTIEKIEKDYGSNIKFKKNKWKHGEFRTIEGSVIEKGGVAYSNVKGKLSAELAKKIPGTKNNSYFWSSGVSVVLHPKNPKIPAMHFNTRFICTKKNWFGGGMDANIILNIKNYVIDIFIYLIEKKSEELVEFSLIIKWIIGKKIFYLLKMLELLLTKLLKIL